MPCTLSFWLGVAWLAAQAAQPPPAVYRLKVTVEPASLVLGQTGSARVQVLFEDGEGAPVAGAAPEVLLRLGVADPLREVGPGRFEAEYHPPTTRFPQLELVIVRIPGRALAWCPLTLVGAGVVRAETEPDAEVRLEVAGKSFGPARADTRGEVLIPFEAPPGVGRGELLTQTGGRRAIDLGVPALQPLWLLAEEPRLSLTGRRGTRLHLFAVDAAGRPWAEAPVSILSDGVELAPLREVSPGYFTSDLRLPPDAGPGEVLVSAELAEPVAGPRAVVRLVVEAPPGSPPPELPPEPPPAEPPPPPPRVWWARPSTYAWVTLGLGLAALVPGGVLTGLDGQETCDGPAAVRCPEVYDTLVPGAVLLGAGAALLGTALILVLVGDEPDEDRPGSTARIGLAPGADGFSLSGTFRF